ncbi:MAG: hypothetical protein HGB34_01165 [Candidatus Moranbacteria bacterium]|nr:hypothetical protein [Candidatus Moranbacteria bacterium]
MDMKSKALAIFFILLLAGSVWSAYLRFFVARDFIIEGWGACDPETDRCFVSECDPELTADEGGCSGNPEDDTVYYSIIRRSAATIPVCAPGSGDCPELSCEANEPNCERIFCTEESSAEEGAYCEGPGLFVPGLDEEEEGEEDGNIIDVLTEEEEEDSEMDEVIEDTGAPCDEREAGCHKNSSEAL